MDAPRSISNIGNHIQTTGVNGFGAGRRFDADKDRPDQTDRELQGRKSTKDDDDVKAPEAEASQDSPQPEQTAEQAPPPAELGKTAPSFVYDPNKAPGLYKGQGRYFEGSA